MSDLPEEHKTNETWKQSQSVAFQTNPGDLAASSPRINKDSPSNVVIGLTGKCELPGFQRSRCQPVVDGVCSARNFVPQGQRSTIQEKICQEEEEAPLDQKYLPSIVHGLPSSSHDESFIRSSGEGVPPFALALNANSLEASFPLIVPRTRRNRSKSPEIGRALAKPSKRRRRSSVQTQPVYLVVSERGNPFERFHKTSRIQNIISQVQDVNDILKRLSKMGDEEDSSFSLGLDHFCTTRKKLWTICSIVAAVLAFIVSIVAGSIHKVNEGNVGIYFKHGALLDHFSLPGIHLKAPFVTDVREVSVRPETDTLPDFNTVTKDGIQNTFFEVQVISDVSMHQIVALIRKFGMDYKQALVFDRIKEELRIFCANHTVDEVYNEKFLDIVQAVKTRTEEKIKRLGMDGIKILNLVIPKPDIPPDIVSNYKAVKVQWTEQLVATQLQRTEQIRKETESMKAVADANRQKAVLQIELQKQVLMKEGEKDVSLLDNEIVRKREESNADVEAYKKIKDAEGNAVLFTKEYVQLEMAKALSNNTKYFFSGEQSVLGALLNRVLGKDSET